MEKNKIQWLKLIPAIVIIAASAYCPGVKDLTGEAISAAGVLAAALWLWSSEALPMSVSIICIIGVVTAEGLLKPMDVVTHFDWKTALFVVASAGITAAMAISTIPQRMTKWLLKLSRDKAGTFVLGFGLLVAACSSVMSSLATCALFAGMVDELLGRQKNSLRRCLMLVIPACAGIGGFMTPAGTPANLLVLSMLKEQGITMYFWQWCVIGIPAGLITALLFICSAVLIIRPSLMELNLTLPPLTKLQRKKDRATIGIILLILVGWMATSWIREIELWHVACAGVFVMLLPPVGILNFNLLRKYIHWDLVITMGTVGIAMGAIANSGLTNWICQHMVISLSNLQPELMLIVVSIEICCIRAFIPTTTGVVMLLGPILIEIAAATGQSVSVLLMVMSFWTACALLLVYTEPIYLLRWQRKDYSAVDLFKSGTIPSLTMATFGCWFIQKLTMLVGQ